MRTTLGVVIGTNVQAYDATLASLAAISGVQGDIMYASGSDSWTRLAKGTAGQILTMNSGATAPEWASAGGLDPNLAAIAGLTSAADTLPYFTGSGTAALATFTSFARSLLDDADAATARTTLGLTIGTDVQAYDNTLAELAAISGVAGDIIYSDGSDSWTRLAKGTSGQVLTMNSGATAPEWAAPAAGGQPIPTNSTYAVGTMLVARFQAVGTVSNGSTTAGTNLKVFTGRFGANQYAGPTDSPPTLSGTWRNISGQAISESFETGQSWGYWVRTA